MKLKGKCALVTGASTGIGHGVALELACQGADVAIGYNRNAEGAMSAVDEITKMGRRAQAFQGDLSSVEDCFALVDRAIEFLGGLDILVNNAGITTRFSFLDVTPQEFDRMYHLNTRGQFFCAQRAARAMRDHGGGVIINISSIQGLAAQPECTVYDGTKGAILATTRAMAIELAPYHIRVVGVAPGIVAVPRNLAMKDLNIESLGESVPWGRVGRPKDIAKVCAFLASDDADFIVGTTVVVDGGTIARMAL